jgi:hypothetical protein
VPHVFAAVASQASASGRSTNMRIPGQGVGMIDWMGWGWQWSRQGSAAISLTLLQSAAHL